MTTATSENRYAPAPPTDAETEAPVVVWPEPSPLRPWWETVMQPAMPADPAVPRSPDPRHPHARNPFLRKDSRRPLSQRGTAHVRAISRRSQ
ncbi:hypothetical protein [Nocardia yunnanensis]|uniref:hypothetical protein n=1 Tax=Nocardia yunnanensis TaxID=2382165 RepID=UPI0013C532F9|nr:hypothetical protein [Nocardia yunnanensis]